jgi:dTDP-4-dehydrorhamnose 3,5-epimerase
MNLQKTAIAGVFTIEPEPIADERGFFARTFDAEVFRAHGLADAYVQQSLAFNARAGTIRGLHYQIGADGEEKIVRCIAGSLYDVVADLRRGSVTFGRFVAVELSAENRRAIYIPRGCAHGYQTLEEGSEALYDISRAYVPAAARGVAHDDPSLAIPWPLPVSVVSERDRAFPALSDAELD